jgi:hypothetical protein
MGFFQSLRSRIIAGAVASVPVNDAVDRTPFLDGPHVIGAHVRKGGVQHETGSNGKTQGRFVLKADGQGVEFGGGKHLDFFPRSGPPSGETLQASCGKPALDQGKMALAPFGLLFGFRALHGRTSSCESGKQTTKDTKRHQGAFGCWRFRLG